MPAPLQDFALFTEGPTDQAILTNVLHGFFKEQREPFITAFHPAPPDMRGGWERLLEKLQQGKHREAFQFNQFVVIQVDTDTAERIGFDVTRRGPDGPLAPEIFVENITERLKAAIGAQDLRTYDGRFLFAVTMEQSECWMLPLWFDDDNAERINDCYTRLLNCTRLWNALRRGQTFTKDAILYGALSKEYRKRRILLEKGPRNPSLKIFLDELEARQIVLPSVD